MSATKYSLRLTEVPRDWDCSFCETRKPAGSVAIEYVIGNVIVKYTCLHHKVCETFYNFGFLCITHEQNKDEDCSEVPF